MKVLQIRIRAFTEGVDDNPDETIEERVINYKFDNTTDNKLIKNVAEINSLILESVSVK